MVSFSAARFGLRVLSNSAGFSRKLFKLNFSVTGKCNSKCKACNIWNSKPQSELSLKEIELLFEKNSFFQWVSLTGGEPFLRSDLAEIASAAKSCSDNLFILNIPTNGSMPKKTESVCEKIISLNIPKFVVTVSIDGPEVLHDSIRGGRGSWEKAVESLGRLMELAACNGNFSVMPAFTITPFNAGCFSETLESLRGIIPGVSANDFSFSFFGKSKHFYGNTSINPGKEFKNIVLGEVKKIRSMRNFSVSSEKAIVNSYLFFLEKFILGEPVPLCRALNASVFVGCTGEVFPCVSLSKKLGGLRETGFDLMQILDSEKTLKLKQFLRKNNCRNCWTPCEANQSMLFNPLLFPSAFLP